LDCASLELLTRAAATLRVGKSAVTANGTGWLANGGSLQSYGDNTVDGNLGGEGAMPLIADK